MLYCSGLVWGVLCLVLSMASAAAAAPPPEYYAVELRAAARLRQRKGKRERLDCEQPGPGGRLRLAILRHFAD